MGEMGGEGFQCRGNGGGCFITVPDGEQPKAAKVTYLFLRPWRGNGKVQLKVDGDGS